MGTRCLTVFVDAGVETERWNEKLRRNVKLRKPKRWTKEIVVMYRQFDGYPEGHGQELADFLVGFKIVNGLYGSLLKVANGMECLAAQVIAKFKTEVGAGGIYLYPAGTRDAGEEWIYSLFPDGDRVRIRVQAGAVTFLGLPGSKQTSMPVLFDGFADEFDQKAIMAEYERQYSQIKNDFVEGEKGGGA